MKRYEDCIREDGECSVCSLSSYGKDCHGKSANKIAWMRNRRGYTQVALAELVELPQTWISKLESGKISAENITLKKAVALADALGVDVRDLM